VTLGTAVAITVKVSRNIEKKTTIKKEERRGVSLAMALSHHVIICSRALCVCVSMPMSVCPSSRRKTACAISTIPRAEQCGAVRCRASLQCNAMRIASSNSFGGVKVSTRGAVTQSTGSDVREMLRLHSTTSTLTPMSMSVSWNVVDIAGDQRHSKYQWPLFNIAVSCSVLLLFFVFLDFWG